MRPEVKKRLRDKAEAAVRSKKERKKLEQIVLRKKHKIDRSQILAQLKKVQLQPEQLDRLHSTSSMQTRGLKRFASDHYEPDSLAALSELDHAEHSLDVAALIKRKRRKKRVDATRLAGSSSSEDTDDVSTDTEIYDDHQGDCDSKQPRTNGKYLAPSVNDTGKTLQTKNDISDQSQSHQVAELRSPEKKIDSKEPAIYVEVSRDPDVEKSRLELPIIGEEQRIMEEIRYNDVVIISGETGSGKTTQLPQFLYEAGYALNGKMIGITEPRRVAAVTMSERVAHELNLKDNEVAYQIRFAGNVSDKTQIKFMTDGVLLKECQHDFLLSNYSVLIIDEAHERSVFSDILIGLLSRIVPLRAKRCNPLKLVIMSATLRVKDFTENSFLFPKTPPLISIDARQYPVTIHFAKHTPDDYLEAAYKKVCAIHNKMPRGGILVFVTSQADVKYLCKRLKKKSMLYCLGLYAMLPLEKQQLVFKEPPEGSRLCVVATNVAETSITIPNVKYVVDTGLEKRKIYDLFTSVSRFVTTWTSKSSSQQRAGRAGRMGPGHCYRLHSSAVFTNDFDEFAEPQILQKPIEDVLLQMKTMNIDNVVNFPFPTRPSIEALKAAERKLIILGALDDSMTKSANVDDVAKTEYASRPTALGKEMAKFAVSARCSKMILLAPQSLLPHVICLVAALTVREMFIKGNEFKELRKKWAGHGYFKLLGDYMVILRAVMESERVECKSKLCQESGLRPKAMLEIDKLRKYLSAQVKSNLKNVSVDLGKQLKRPSETQCKMLRQLLLSSFCDHVARKIPDGEILETKPNPNIDGNQAKTKKKLKHAYECLESDEPIYIDSDSVLRGQHPNYLIYKELFKGEKKTYMRDVAVIEHDWLPKED